MHSVTGCGQTGRFRIWVNSKQNSRLINLISSRNRIVVTISVQINSIDQKTALKAWSWSKDGFEEMEQNFRLEHSVRKTGWTTFSDVPLLPEFFAGMSQEVVLHLLSKQIFRKLFAKGEQPQFPWKL